MSKVQYGLLCLASAAVVAVKYTYYVSAHQYQTSPHCCNAPLNKQFLNPAKH